MNLPKLHRITGEFSLMNSEKKEIFPLTHSAIDELCHRSNAHAALVEALELFLSYDMQQGTYDSLRLNPAGQDGMTPEQMIYLDAVDAARSALSAAKL